MEMVDELIAAGSRVAVQVFVVVVTYNPKRWIHECFGSLRNSSLPVKTIVIDNGSVDGSPEILRSSYPEVDFIQADTNLGFGRANNLGIQRALRQGADFVFLLNQDAWVEPDTIEGLVALHLANPEYGILSGMHLNRDFSALDLNFSKFSFSPRLFSDLYVGKTERVYEVSFINAAAWLLSKTCLEVVGVFDPIFFHYGEDANYCQRTLFHRFKLGICPEYKLVHDRPGREGLPAEIGPQRKAEILYLMRLTDVNNFRPVGSYLYCLLKELLLMLAGATTLRKGKAVLHYKLLNFLLSKRKGVFESIRRNSKPALRSTEIKNVSVGNRF